jgi:hypothetical protein
MSTEMTLPLKANDNFPDAIDDAGGHHFATCGLHRDLIIQSVNGYAEAIRQRDELIGIMGIAEATPELDMNNYHVDEVRKLNDGIIDCILKFHDFMNKYKLSNLPAPVAEGEPSK